MTQCVYICEYVINTKTHYVLLNMFSNTPAMIIKQSILINNYLKHILYLYNKAFNNHIFIAYNIFNKAFVILWLLSVTSRDTV